MKFSGLTAFGRISTRMAAWMAPPYTGLFDLSRLNRRGYIDAQSIIDHKDLHLGDNIFIADRVVIRQSELGGHVHIGDRVHILRDTIIVSGQRGSVFISEDTYIQPSCMIMGYKGPIQIGKKVQIAPKCAFYSYNHGFEDGELIINQPLTTKGGIKIEDDVWIGYGAIVLDGVIIGKGSVVGAGSVVTHNIPQSGIAAGNPAKILKFRKNY